MVTLLSRDERARLGEALAAVCHEAGIEPAGAQLVKYTMNAVYRLDHAGVVVRIAPAAVAERVERVVRAATVLAALAAPVARLAPGHERAVHVGDWSASIWTLMPQPSNRTWAPTDLVRPLRAIHAIDNAPSGMPRWNTLQKTGQRLAGFSQLDDADRQLLHELSTREVGLSLDEVVDRLERWNHRLEHDVAHLDWQLPEGLIHGDAHTGNLLVDDEGEPLLCDLDSTCIGPREWDLVPAAHGVTRFGRDRSAYRELVADYGFDIMRWSGWDTLRQVRELQLLTSVMTSVHGRPAVAKQLAHRLRSIFAGDATAIWQRYE